MRTTQLAYRNGTIPPVEPPMWISRSVGAALDAMSLGSVDEIAETLPVARTTGARRARQGVPVAALARAYHVGGRLINATVAQWAAEQGLASERSAAFMDTVLTVAEQHSRAAIEAHQELWRSLPPVPAAESLLHALLNGETSAVVAGELARELALPEHGRYAVIVLRPGAPGGAPRPLAELPTWISGLRTVWRAQHDVAFGVVVLKDTAAAALGDGLPVTGARIGVSAAVPGLTELGRARRQAELAERTLGRGTGVAHFEGRLTKAMLTTAPDVALQMQSRVLAPVLDLDEATRDVLLGTLRAWRDADGSMAEAAKALYCHRNTVLYRLRKLERLTRRSLSSPQEMIEIVLAAEAFELTHGGGTAHRESGAPPFPSSQLDMTTYPHGNS
ncbi:helix-turn-helix domain-containing protein [Streptomyces sp. TRM66268-LWL]|uniref:Helix-turn-helix domain-containing protein n=1 Tax=Streptomyces polyasparticus TaxID=2767826 RepID=A0ABR7SQ69_9ACTN|nr:helix-turn-helix domain-containing protein [Streptomyces polyasparticus]MBC9716483.1 helix-turn-helix domain-containing protein [Streptomyces polyasparticus]